MTKEKIQKLKKEEEKINKHINEAQEQLKKLIEYGEEKFDEYLNSILGGVTKIYGYEYATSYALKNVSETAYNQEKSKFYDKLIAQKEKVIYNLKQKIEEINKKIEELQKEPIVFIKTQVIKPSLLCEKCGQDLFVCDLCYENFLNCENIYCAKQDNMHICEKCMGKKQKKIKGEKK